MAQPELKVLLDWANEGDTPDVINLSAQINQTQINRGRNIIQDSYEVGTASFRIIDPDGDWNPQNVSSPYYGKIVPLRKVAIYGRWLGIDYPLFAGFTVTYDYTYPRDQEFGYVTIRCEDAFRLFNMANITTVTGGTLGQTTGQRINSILDQINWSATNRAIDTGLSTCLADPATTRTSLDAMRVVEFTEGLGAFYMSADGKATFKDRQNSIIGFAPRSTRTNLVVNPSFETNTTAWTGSSGTIARIETDSYVGKASLSYTNTASGSTSGGANFLSATGGRTAVDASTTYTISCYVFVPVGQASVSMRFRRTEFTAVSGGSQVGGIILSTTTTFTAGSGWNRFSKTFTTQAGVAAIAVARLEQGTAATLGQVFYIDAVMLEKASTADYYFDGNENLYPTNFAANSSWTGIANLSNSIVSYLTYPNPVSFGQTPPAIPYNNIVFALDDKLLVNQATFARVGGTDQSNTDSASVAKYFVHSINKSNLLMQTDDLALDLARAYVAGRQDTAIRIENLAIELNAITTSNDVISILDIDYFDKVQISNVQPGGSTITQTLFVQGLKHDIRPDSWVTTIQTYESLLDGLILNDSVKGTLDYNVLGY
jgi:hypothetical protein